jgi:hypothetical protein
LAARRGAIVVGEQIFRQRRDEMGFLAFGAIVIVALGIGVAVQVLEKKVGYDWLMVAFIFAFGAYFSSETFPGSATFEVIKNWGPQVDGFYIIPGIVTGAVLALLAYFGTRNLPTTTSAA